MEHDLPMNADSPHERYWRENLVLSPTAGRGGATPLSAVAEEGDPAPGPTTKADPQTKKKLGIKDIVNAVRGRADKRRVFLVRLALAAVITTVITVVVLIVSPKMVRIEKKDSSGRTVSKPCVPSSLAVGAFSGAAALGIPYIADFISLKGKPKK